MSATGDNRVHHYAIPRSGIAYVDCLYNEVARLGVRFEKGDRGLRWFITHVSRGDTLHIHWPSTLYHVERSTLQTYARLLRFAAQLTIARIRGVRVLWTAHNLYPHDGGQSRRAHRIARRLVVAHAQTIFVHGKRARDLIEAHFPGAVGKTVIVPHGHWIDCYPERVSQMEARRRLKLSASQYVFAFVGHCKRYKGLEELIDAFLRMPPKATLLIAGEFESPAYFDEIRARLADIPDARVRIHPRYLTPDELRDHVCAADAIVLPYRAILTSGSLMLGLSFGVPVIASQRGAIGDFLSPEVGETYDPEDADGLYAAMVRIRRRAFSAAAIIDYARTFDWRDTAVAVVEALRQAPQSVELPVAEPTLPRK